MNQSFLSMNEENSVQVSRSANAISEWSIELLTNAGIPEGAVKYVNLLLMIVVLLVLVILVQFITRYTLRSILKRSAKITNIDFLNHLYKRKFAYYVAMIIPFSLVKWAIPVVFNDFPATMVTINKLLNIFLIFYVIWVIVAILNAFTDVLRKKPSMADKPLDSYVQVVRIVLYSIGFIIFISILTGQKPLVILGGLGAASAILMLVFKDTILGLVASMQVSANDMVRIGDWITMPKYGADGDVIQITLTTVKIRNFDKTITTIPPYSLISDSFQNWRGMVETGARRVKRSVFVKQSTIHFLSKEELDRLKNIQVIADHISVRGAEIDNYNQKIGADKSIALNGRNLTNMGLFRQYVKNYLSRHPDVRQDMLLIVRQLHPTSKGLPLELYFFTATTNWLKYEDITSDIFDHVTAAAAYFDLELFEDISNPVVSAGS